MVIVNIEDFFHPNAGYQINILPKYFAKHGFDTYILTSEMEKVPKGLTDFFGTDNIDKYDKEYEKKTGVKIIRIPVHRFVSNRAIFTGELDCCLNKINPDIVFVHGNDTWEGIKYIYNYDNKKFALVSDSHMLAMASNNRLRGFFRLFYRLFVTPKIKKFNIPIIRTQNDDYVNKYLGIPLDLSPWISYGSDTLLFHPDIEIKNEFKRRYNISEDAFVVLYAGKLDESKGGLFLAEAIKNRISANREVVFVIVGNANGEYGNKVEKLFASSENKIIRFPTQRYFDLGEFFQAADLVVFPKQCSLSFYDAQACGIPVLSEDNSINVDRNSYGNGLCFKQGSIESFLDNLLKFINMPHDEYVNMSINSYNLIKNNYDYEEKSKEYERVILNAYERFKKH